MKKTILPKGHLLLPDAEKLMHLVGKSGLFQKINFAGGEPTLHPHLTALIKIAESYGLTTSIVTNGTKLTEAFLHNLHGYLDWIALSIDSLEDDINLKTGRALVGKTAISKTAYLDKIALIKSFGYKLKINTVVHAMNFEEDFRDFIKQVQPNRWKILQVLEIEGENEKTVKPFLITDAQFRDFVSRHSTLENLTDLAPETTEQIKGSYIMINPAGQFFENIAGCYHESSPIIQVGVNEALAQIRTDIDKFVERKGLYAW